MRMRMIAMNNPNRFRKFKELLATPAPDAVTTDRARAREILMQTIAPPPPNRAARRKASARRPDRMIRRGLRDE